MAETRHTVSKDEFTFIREILINIGLEKVKILYIIPGYNEYAVHISFTYEGKRKQRFMSVQKKSGFAEPF